METRELPVLSSEDRNFVRRLSVGLSDDAARALAYLVLREECEKVGDRPASLPELRLGTDLNRSAAIQALEMLVDRGFVDRTSLRTGERGRPPTAWCPSVTRESVFARLYRSHVRALLEQALRVLALGDTVLESPPEGEGGHASDRDFLVALNWRPNGLHAPVFAAEADGRFADYGLSVEIETNDGSRDALETLATGRADIGIAGAATIVRVRASGTPIVPLALFYQRATTVLYSVRDHLGEPLTDLSQLAGYRVGMPIESKVGLLGRLFLLQRNVLDDVELVDLTGEEDTSLRSRDVDVVTGSFADPWRLEADGFDVDVLPIADQFPIYGPALAVHEDVIATQPRLVRDGLHAIVAGWDSARRQPLKAARAVAEAGGQSADRERRVFEHAAREFGHSEAVRDNGWGWHRDDGWERLETALEQVDLLQP